MRNRSVVLLLWCALLVSGCTSGYMQYYKPQTQDETIIVSMLMKIPNGIKARSVDMILQPYSEDVYVGNFSKYLGVASQAAPLSVTKADLREIYGSVFRVSKDISMDVKNFQLHVSGDRAVAEARTELLFKKEASRGEERQDLFTNDVTWRMRKTPTGWKIVEEIWQ